MFHESKVPGTVCVYNKSEASEATWYQEAAAEATRCAPVESPLPKVESLDKTLLAFRFPTDQTKPSSYSRWNWRLIGSLYLRLSINNEVISIEDDLLESRNVTASFAVNR